MKRYEASQDFLWEFDDDNWKPEPPPYGAIIQDDRDVRYMLIRTSPSNTLAEGTVIRLTDAMILHPSWMEFPVKVIANHLDDLVSNKFQSYMRGTI